MKGSKLLLHCPKLLDIPDFLDFLYQEFPENLGSPDFLYQESPESLGNLDFLIFLGHLVFLV